MQQRPELQQLLLLRSLDLGLLADLTVPEARSWLESIKGIGPETARRLRADGVTSIEQIAAWTPEDVRRIAERIETDSERIEREDWVGQARAVSGAASGVA